MANVKVRAVENGHDGIQYRSAGEVFEVSRERVKDGSTWFEVVKSRDPDPDPDPDFPVE